MFGSRKNKLIPAWRFKSAGVLWRVVPTASGRIIGEARNIQEKSVAFFCLSHKDGKVLWDKKAFGEQWWIGIEALAADTLFLHKYTTPELPEHRGVIAVDVTSGEELWRNEEVKLLAVYENALSVLRSANEGGEAMNLDLRTGKPISGSIATREISPSQSEFPQLLVGEQDANRVIWKNIVRDRLVGPVEYLESSRFLIFCHHEQHASASDGQQTLDTILNVVDRTTELNLFSEVIQKNSPAIIPENFFVENGILFFIHERSALTAIVLE